MQYDRTTMKPQIMVDVRARQRNRYMTRKRSLDRRRMPPLITRSHAVQINNADRGDEVAKTL